jgi:hypothetical protein
LIDGTPHGSSVQPLQSLKERATEQAQQQQQIEQEILKNLDQINDLIEAHKGDPKALNQAIQELYNGNLEDTMNAILHHKVTSEHYQRILNIFNAYRYSPIKDTTNPAEIKAFLASQIDSTPAEDLSHQEAGSQLFGVVHSFIERFGQEGTHLEGFETLTKLIELSQEFLDQNEYLALLIIAKYLKAEKMFK